MKLTEFSFELPAELIAQTPVTPRDSARLLVYDRLKDTLLHAHVRDLGSFLKPQTALVVNNSRVRKSRFFGLVGQKKIEVLILEELSPFCYRCLIGGKGLQPGDRIQFYQNEQHKTPLTLSATVQSQKNHPSMSTYILQFALPLPQPDLEAYFEQHGQAPLPPYIQKSSVDPARYQTIYADPLGSAAAPTAGLHFTPELKAHLLAAGHSWAEVTLHVGLGTFLPLRQEQIEANQLHAEETLINQATAELLNQQKTAKLPILAVGTTSTRTLEAHTREQHIQAGPLSTNLFIYPGFVFQSVNALLTNFHLPRSSLLLLVAAFLGNHPEEQRLISSPEEMVSRLHRIYQTAIEHKYRFYSFGDALLIL